MLPLIWLMLLANKYRSSSQNNSSAIIRRRDELENKRTEEIKLKQVSDFKSGDIIEDFFTGDMSDEFPFD